MADTKRTLSALQTLLADNLTGNISAQDARDLLLSTYGILWSRAIVAGDSPYTMINNDFALYCDASGGNLIVNLTNTGSEDQFVYIIKSDSSSNKITVQPLGGDTFIGGVSSIIIQDGALLLHKRGTTWSVVCDQRSFASFTEKVVPASSDLILIADSADSGIKKKMTLLNSSLYVKDFIQGLLASPNVATPLSKVDIGYGACRNDADSQNMLLSSEITGIDITASGVNGLDSGVEEASQWYAIWLIYNPTTLTYAGLLSLVPRRSATNNPSAGSNVVINIANTKGYFVGQTVVVAGTGALTYEICTITVVTVNTSITVATLAASYTTPTVRAIDKIGDTVIMPSGYTIKRRVGMVRNDAGSNFVPFKYYGKSTHRIYGYQSSWLADRNVVSSLSLSAETGVHLYPHVPSTANRVWLVAGATGGTTAHSFRAYPQTIDTQFTLGVARQHIPIESIYAIVEIIRTAGSGNIDVYLEYFEEDI